MAQLGNLLVKGSSRFLNKAYFEDISIAGTSFFSDNISTDGTLNIGANKASNALLYLNKKIAIRGVDSWLRINDTSTNFTSGVYFGSSDVRTDKAFQVGDGGKYFKINSSSLDVNVPSAFSQRTIHNGGLISSTISSNLISFVKNGNTLPKIDGVDATAILNELTVLSTLRAKEYELDHVQNLGGTFMVSPSFICTEGSTSVTVSAISDSEVTFVIKDNATLTKTEIATASWVLNSQIKLSGKIGNAILANATGTITKSVDTNNHTITVKVDVGSSTVGNFTVNTTYSGNQVSKLALMMFRNASGYRLGIYLESYSSENKKPVINIFDGSGTDPKVVLGKLDGTPKVNNVSPTGYGLYSDNAFLKGTIIATSGTIGGFTLSTNSIQNGTFGQDGSVMMCLGSNNSVSIGGSGNINGWTFTAGSKFGVTKNGAMYATSGKIGKYTITDSCLTTGGGSGCTGMGGTHAFWAGSDDSSNAPFRVGYNGLLYASSATIAGNITATSGTIGGCSIKNNVLQIANANINSIDAGKITSGTINADRIGSGTITADKIAIGDFTNYANLNEKTASKYGFTTVQDDSALGNPWFQLNTLKRDVPITPNAYEEYNCNGGESFKIEGEVYSTVTGKKYKESTNVETLQIGIGLYGKKESGDAYWLISYFSLAENNGKLNAYVTLDNAVRKFGINIQINGTSDFSGILKVRNIKVTRMTDNSLIVNGSITSNKITTDNITGTNGWINLRSGLFDYGNGKLKWDGKTLTVAGSGTFAGEITAKSGKIGKYTITDSYLITGNNSTCTGIGGNQAFWAGSDSSNDAPFRVGYDGSLYSSKGNIAGWEITSDSFYKDTDDYTVYVCPGTNNNKDFLTVHDKNKSSGDEWPFYVHADGWMHCVYGDIGGWNISDSSIYKNGGWKSSSSGSAYFGDYGLSITDKFSVDKNGVLMASDSILSGNVYLSDGSKNIGRFDTGTYNGIKGAALVSLIDGGYSALGNYNSSDNKVYIAAYAKNKKFYVPSDFYVSNLVANDGTIYVSSQMFVSKPIDTNNNTYIFTRTKENYKVSLIGWSVSNNIWIGDYGYGGVRTPASNAFITANNVYKTTSGGNTSLSDERYKHGFKDIPDAFDFIMNLNPCLFKFDDGTSDRYHMGFKAQEVENNMLNTIGDTGLTVKYNFEEGLDVDLDNPDTYILGLRYEEFIAPLIQVVQNQQKQIQDLEKKIAILSN